MPLTPNFSIFYRDTSTPASLETESALQADSVDDALTLAITGNRQIQTFRWANAAARAAQTGMVAGDVGYQVDTGVNYQYSTTWLANRVAISITAGTNCTINSSTRVYKNEITGMIVANLDISRTTGSFTTGDAIATFPVGSRPASVLGAGAGFVNATPVFAALSAAGVVNIYFTGTTTNQFRGTFVYYV